MFYRIVQRPNVGHIFVSQDLSEMQFKRAEDLVELIHSNGVGNNWVALDLLPFDPEMFREHDHAIAAISRELYEPLGIVSEKIFSGDTCMNGNVMLSGIRCMQRTSRLHFGGRYAGYVFDVNKTRFGKTQRRGRGWEGSVQRYICIVPSTGTKAEEKFDAKAYIQNCGVQFQYHMDFRAWCVSDQRPRNFPARPDVIYRDNGWQGYENFLGYEETSRAGGLEPFQGRASRRCRTAIERRGTTQTALMRRFAAEMPEFEVRPLSPRRTSILLVRRRPDVEEASSDEWIALQMKFASSASAYTKYHQGERYVFHHVMRREDVGLLFVSDNLLLSLLRVRFLADKS
eukprot:g10645.t1